MFQYETATFMLHTLKVWLHEKKTSEDVAGETKESNTEIKQNERIII